MGDEWVEVVDDEDRVLRQVTRAEMRRDNLLHRSVSVLCQNSAGAIYVHRRTDDKDVWPGLHDMFCGGVVSAGEGYAEAARREAQEELGVHGVEPSFLFTHRYDGEHSRSQIHAFTVVYDGPIVHQPAEVAWGRFCTLQEIVDNPEGWSFVPDGAELFGRYQALRR